MSDAEEDSHNQVAAAGNGNGDENDDDADLTLTERLVWDKACPGGYPPRSSPSPPATSHGVDESDDGAPSPDDSIVLRVMFWNIQYGHTARSIVENNVAAGGGGNSNPLLENLITLSSPPPSGVETEGNSSTNSSPSPSPWRNHRQYDDSSPDVIILAEIEGDTLDADVRSHLESTHPHHHNYWPYNPDAPERGIGVYSRYPFSVRRTVPLDYYPTSLSEEVNGDEIDEYKRGWRDDFPPERFFPRTYVNLELEVPAPSTRSPSRRGAGDGDGSGGGNKNEEEDDEARKKVLHLVPFHALLHVEKEFRDAGGDEAGFLRKTWIRLKFLFGRHNPLVYQLLRLRATMREDFGDVGNNPGGDGDGDGDGDGPGVLLMGDFNLPPRIGPLMTHPYRVLSEGLVDLFDDAPEGRQRGREPTWPMPSDPEFGEKSGSMSYQFDHALASENVDCPLAKVLPLRGSDHAAILVDVAL